MLVFEIKRYGDVVVSLMYDGVEYTCSVEPFYPGE